MTMTISFIMMAVISAGIDTIQEKCKGTKTFLMWKNLTKVFQVFVVGMLVVSNL